jgi:acetyl esterase
VFDGQMHGFFHMVNVLPASADGVAFIARSLDEALTGSSTAGQA